MALAGKKLTTYTVQQMITKIQKLFQAITFSGSITFSVVTRLPVVYMLTEELMVYSKFKSLIFCLDPIIFFSKNT